MASAEVRAVSPENGTGTTDQPSTSAGPGAQKANDDTSKLVQDVLSSEIGISVMLNRLKQSITSAKEFSQFLKKRAQLEEEHANSLKKLCKSSHEIMQRGEHRGGTFGKAYEEMLMVHERMADNGLMFATSLHQMSEDLNELAQVADKSRKGWKQSGLAAEQRVAELEAAMRKSKSKYDALAEEYDRARTGDTSGRQGGKMFGFKGHKSGAQHEEDLLRKAQAAEQDYQGKVQVAASERSELEAKTRPETVQALQDLIRECDSGLALQMQKFASFNEKLVLSNGLSISPLKKEGNECKSLRECILAIDNEKDLNDYLMSHHPRLQPKTGLPKYEKNHLLDAHRTPAASTQNISQHQGSSGGYQPPPNMFPSNSRSNTFSETPLSTSAPLGHSYGQSVGSVPLLGGATRPSSQPQHERSFSHGNLLNQASSSGGQQYRSVIPQSQPSNVRYNGGYGSTSTSQGPPQLGVLPFQSSQSQQPQSQSYGQSQQGSSSSTALQRASPPLGPHLSQPVFGVSLARLYERDGLAVPMVVYQCIQAVDLFGLNVEGIYRLSGSLPHVNKLKHLFDTDCHSENLDFRNPENFFHDVNSVAGLLKQFFRDLPDPLMTRENYQAFIEAAKHEDDIVRRDSLHAIINSLPDPNYATLRALVLHLHRVMENSASNRMSSQNLAIVFGPTLMGTAPGGNVADAGWQVRVIDTILQNTFQIFDDDD